MSEDLLIKYLTHTASEEELEMIGAWISADSRNAEWLFEMERVWTLRDELKYSDQERIQEAYKRFVSSLPEKEDVPAVPWEIRSGRWWMRSLVKYAAVVACTFALSFGLFKLTESKKQLAEVYNKIEVPSGQRVSLTLSDGTKVWLNAQSKLIYPSAFDGEERKVRLEGEGFFEVSHNPEKPFIVDGDLLEVKVLGTKFNYRSYKDEDATVTLAEGKVEVSTYDGANNLTLKPAEQVVYSVGEGISLHKHIDSELQKSWIKGETVFQDQPLSMICKDLERKFGVVIDIEDPELAEQLFTCRFKESLNIQQVMNLLRETRELNYTVNGSHITIKKK